MTLRTLRQLAILAVLAGGLGLAACGEQKRGRDTLVIGMTQYPATLNPNIESMLAKTYVLAMTRRPFTHHDVDWKLVCALCETLPTLENGLAVPETLANGKKGVAVTYTIKQGATWGDGTPVTTKDVMLTWEIGRHPRSGVINRDFYQRIRSIDVHDDKRFTAHLDKVYFDLTGEYGFDPEHSSQTNYHLFVAGPETRL